MSLKLYKLRSLYDLQALENPTFSSVGNLRKITLLDWIFRFRYSTVPVLTALFPDVAHSRIIDLLSRMEKRGEIRKFALITGFTKVGYCLREKGFLLLQQHFENRLFGRFFTETATLSPSNFVHDLAIQHSIATFINSDVNQIGFANEWEIRSHFEGQKTKILDAATELTLNDKKIIAGIEVELSPKTAKRLSLALKASEELISNRHIDIVFYLCPTPALERSIKARIKDLGLSEKHYRTRVSPQLKQLICGGRA